MGETAEYKECGWEGGWEEVWVEMPDAADDDKVIIGPDPGREHTDPPYYCPECGEEI